MTVRLLASAISLSLLAGCATVPGNDALAEKDPLEKVNRDVWAVNMAVDKVMLKPAGSVYRAVTPKPVRHNVSNFFANLAEPWSFINNILQGKGNRAGSNVGRFLVNSTIGVGGLFDVASKWGIHNSPEDFGQTLAKWGFDSGAYLVLPILGPSTVRDGVGSVAYFYGDPVSYGINQAEVSVWYKRGYRALYTVSTRSDLTEAGGDTFLQSSLDPYAAARSAYLQRRRSQILDQEDSLDAGPPDADVPAPVAPTGEAPANGAALPESSAPLPGDAPAAPAQPGASLPPSAAPLPGDMPTASPAAAQPGAPLPQSAAPLPGDAPPAATPPQP